MVWRDDLGRALTDHPRPSVAVDVAVLTVVDDRLHVVAVEGPHGVALPGTFLHPGERLADAAVRALRTKVGVSDLDFHQLAMHDDPDRDDRGWVLSMAHGAVTPAAALPPGTRLVAVVDGRPTQRLAFDHDAMVAHAVDDLRARYADRPDPDHVLGERFTLLDLRRLHEAVADRELPKDTFRRRMLPFLSGTGEFSTADVGRPAEVFTPRPQD
ncbi:NUDIX domain-containing protein [Williamsia herbipolensis]|uniref:NUDIX domain-containing protein n=1 Tax=Williamsia herbipolensis TaxID=1603258 RepID=A0AAU4K173_9NOCA|nr:NUDIX domain-containing protein [Williamsia herbipolensis]